MWVFSNDKQLKLFEDARIEITKLIPEKYKDLYKTHWSIDDSGSEDIVKIGIYIDPDCKDFETAKKEIESALSKTKHKITVHDKDYSRDIYEKTKLIKLFSDINKKIPPKYKNFAEPVSISPDKKITFYIKPECKNKKTAEKEIKKALPDYDISFSYAPTQAQ